LYHILKEGAMGARPPPDVPRRRGRPRSDQATAAILHAAGELLAEEGLLAMTLDAVAARAGTSRATIYRWWDSKETLALDTIEAQFAAHIERAIIDTGSLAGDLLAGIEARLRAVRAPGMMRLWAAMIGHAHADPAFGDAYRARFFTPVRESAHAAFARAIARGEIPAETDIELALDLLFGAVTNRMLHANAPVDAQFARDVVRSVMQGLIAREPSGE
jgi:AcrR family transcriptional regulator